MAVIIVFLNMDVSTIIFHSQYHNRLVFPSSVAPPPPPPQTICDDNDEDEDKDNDNELENVVEARHYCSSTVHGVVIFCVRVWCVMNVCEVVGGVALCTDHQCTPFHSQAFCHTKVISLTNTRFFCKPISIFVGHSLSLSEHCVVVTVSFFFLV